MLLITCYLCFSCHLQQSAQTELSAAAVQQLPQQHVSSTQHLCHSPLHTLVLFLLLASAPERPQHGSTSAHSDIIIILLFLPPRQPIAAEYLSDRRRYFAVTCLRAELCTERFFKNVDVKYVVVGVQERSIKQSSKLWADSLGFTE